MRVVVALGGNALLRRGEAAEAETQRAHVREATSALAALARRAEVVVTHGNGPQVGLLALEGAAYDAVEPYPLDVLGAETQGMIGYFLIEALSRELGSHSAAALLTRVVVSEDDPAFGAPTKPIGPVYTRDEAQALAAARGWTVAPDGTSFRRVVASPEPRDIVELGAIERLLVAGTLVVCGGGGGIPVVVADGGGYRGVEAVVDKDLTAALLAERLEADRLVLLTDVPYVECDWRKPSARPIFFATPTELRGLDFAEGSMRPKVEAGCRFAERTGGECVIGSLSELDSIMCGSAGTRIALGASYPVRSLAY